ncbi:hypothetical protein MKEN_00275000 [Mycena kentingensis (nom. inval.)]|nr:hypothetical protein MKEN_00275000 [Mycena kentingensis (nom. inval.)]
MHPVFELKNLEKLPLRARLAATRPLSAQTWSAAASDFDTLVDHFESPGILPLYWTLLDPARIPSSPCAGDILPLKGATFAMHGLSIIAGETVDVPGVTAARLVDRYRLLWQRLFYWIGFIQDNYTDLSYSFRSAEAEPPLLAEFCKCTIFLYTPGEQHLLRAHVGFYRVIFRAWRVLVDTREIWFINDDAVAGAGGCIDSLAVLWVDHLQLFQKLLRSKDEVHNERLFAAIYTVVRVVGLISVIADASSARGGPAAFFYAVFDRLRPSFFLSLIRDLAAPKTAILRETPDGRPHWQSMVAGILLLLKSFLLSKTSRLRAAIRHGLLATLLETLRAAPMQSPTIHEGFVALLSDALRPATLCSSLNALLDNAFSELEGGGDQRRGV